MIDGADLTLRLYTTGPGEDTEHTVAYIPELKTILPNDLVYNGWHPWNDLERDGHWLRTFQDLRLKYAGRYSIKDMPPENRRHMMAELNALFPDWYDEEIPFSCGHVVSVPYSYGENRFSVDEF